MKTILYTYSCYNGVSGNMVFTGSLAVNTDKEIENAINFLKHNVPDIKVIVL